MAQTRTRTTKKAKTVSEYLAALPADRRKALSEVRKVIRKNLDKGIQETINWGMITYEIPLKTYPDTYNGKPMMFAALASQKNHLGIYLMCAYADKEADRYLREQHKARGMKLDMGKSCIRFKALDEVPLDVIGRVIKSMTLKKFIAQCEKSRRR